LVLLVVLGHHQGQKVVLHHPLQAVLFLGLRVFEHLALLLQQELDNSHSMYKAMRIKT
jgi:small basic protein